MAFTTEVLDEILRGYHGSRVDFTGSLFGQRSMRAAIGLWLAMKGNLPLGGVSKFDKIHGAVYTINSEGLMNMTAFFKAVRKFVFLAFALLLCGCIYTKSGNKNFNRNIEITVTLGKAYIDISGHIGEDIYLDTGKKDVMNTTVKNPVVMQGQKTINKKILLHATQKFEYTLTTAEIVIMTIKSIDDNDVTITVFEYGKTTEYKIDGKNKFGQTILFRN